MAGSLTKLLSAVYALTGTLCGMSLGINWRAIHHFSAMWQAETQIDSNGAEGVKVERQTRHNAGAKPQRKKRCLEFEKQDDNTEVNNLFA